MKYQAINKESLQRLMDVFYAKVRKNEALGPIFNDKIGTDDASWEHHKKKIASFWGGIFLGEQDYHGAPLRAHLDLPPFPREFFQIWLNLFAESAQMIFEQESAQTILQKAQDIAKRFQTILYDMPH